MDKAFEQLKRDLKLCNPQKLKIPTGLSTGYPQLDGYLASGGLPKGELSLFKADLGLGSSSLWLNTARSLTSQGHYVAWVGKQQILFPLALEQRRVDLKRLIIIEPPANDKKVYWTLQEILSADLFGLVGCDLNELSLRPHHFRKLLRQVQISRVALVFFCSRLPSSSGLDCFSLVLHFHRNGITALRARHRPTPFTIFRRWSYAHLMSEYRENQRSRTDGYFSQIQPPPPVP